MLKLAILSAIIAALCFLNFQAGRYYGNYEKKCDTAKTASTLN